MRNTRVKIEKRVSQGDFLSATLFNIVLEYATRNINKGIINTREGQILAYADDLVIITKTRDAEIKWNKLPSTVFPDK